MIVLIKDNQIKLGTVYYLILQHIFRNMIYTLQSDRTYMKILNQSRLSERTCEAHIKITSLSASSPDSDDFLPAALSLSGLADWSFVLKGPWSSELVRKGLRRWGSADLTEKKEGYRWRAENYNLVIKLWQEIHWDLRRICTYLDLNMQIPTLIESGIQCKTKNLFSWLWYLTK